MRVTVGYDEVTSSTKSAVFGLLVKAAIPVLQHFHSDLFHDALFIEKFLVTTPTTFVYGVRDTGTDLASPLTPETRERYISNLSEHNEKLFVVDIFKNPNGRIEAVIERHKGES